MKTLAHVLCSLVLCSLAFLGVAISMSYAATVPAINGAGGHGLAVGVNAPAAVQGQILDVSHWETVHAWHGRGWHKGWYHHWNDPPNDPVGDHNVPELDPGLLASGMALFAVSSLLLLERRRRE